MEVKYELEGEPFVWNDNKAESNETKHGVGFQEACEVFFDPFYKMYEDSQNQEYRYQLLGYSDSGRLLFVVVSDDEAGVWRIITARLATARERVGYEKEDDT